MVSEPDEVPQDWAKRLEDVDGFGDEQLEENEREDRVRRPPTTKECKFTGVQDLLADDFVEGVQAILHWDFSGNCWVGSTIWVQET